MERIESWWELAEREPLVRWSGLATLGLLWLTVAWLSPIPLLAAFALVGTVFVVRRRRGETSGESDDDLDVL